MVLYLALGAAALAWAGLRGQTNIWQLPGRGEPLVLAGIATGILIGLGIVFVSRLALYRFDWARSLHREFRGLLNPMSDFEIVVLAVASSVGEEMFFRGALLPHIGLYASSVLFAALHVRPHLRFLPWTLMSLIVGLIMGEMYVNLGDLGGPIAAHFTINLLNLEYISKNELRM